MTSAYGPQDMDLRSKQGPVSFKNYLFIFIILKLKWSEKVEILFEKYRPHSKMHDVFKMATLLMINVSKIKLCSIKIVWYIL